MFLLNCVNHFIGKKESILDISRTRCRKQVKLSYTFFDIDILLMARKVFHSEINTHGVNKLIYSKIVQSFSYQCS